jgi:hypothetical protein
VSAPTAGYSGTPLPRKLGIAAGHRVLLVAAPGEFDLGPLPDGVTVVSMRTPGNASRRARPPFDVVLDFCADRAALLATFAPLLDRLAPASALWVAWPKKASGVRTDLDDNVVREHGLAVGLVDVKVAAVDAVWSGLKFVYRLSDRAKVSSTHA